MVEKTKNGRKYTYPTQADHFVLKDAPKLEEWFAGRDITKPRELDVILPFPTLAANFDASYNVWASQVLLCKGDGRHVLLANPMRVEQDKKGTHVYNEAGPTLVVDGVAQVPFGWGDRTFVEEEIVECPGRAGADGGYPHCAACKMSAILKVTPYHPDVFGFGFYQITTGSWRNYDTIMGTLEALPPIVFENHMPFTLRLVQEQVGYKDGQGKRQTAEKWFLQLIPHPDLLRALWQKQAQEMITGPQQFPRLPAPEIVQAEPDEMPPYAEVGVEIGADDGEWVEWPTDDEDDEGDEDEPPPEPPPEPPKPTPPPAEKPAKKTSARKATTKKAPAAEKAPEKEEKPAPSRPYDPEALRARVLGVTATAAGGARPSVVQIGLALALFRQVWEKEADEFVPKVLGYLFGKKLPQECNGKEIGALIEWLKDREKSKDGHTIVCEEAKAEANSVVRLMLEREGQSLLPGFEPE